MQANLPYMTYVIVQLVQLVLYISSHYQMQGDALPQG